MNKILVSVEVPSIDQSFDVFIPPMISVKQLIQLLSEGISSLSEGKYKKTAVSLLCLKERRCILNPEGIIEECAIKNGNHLILF